MKKKADDKYNMQNYPAYKKLNIFQRTVFDIEYSISVEELYQNLFQNKYAKEFCRLQISPPACTELE